MENGGTQNLIHANFFFVDGVGLSDPNMSTKTQLKKIETINKFVKECETYKNTSQKEILFLPTGDGMCIGFLQGEDKPLKLAIELHKKLDEYNKGKIPSEVIKTRIGLHSGNCFVFDDVQNNKSVWGPGIILAKRVMDLGDDNHILLSNRMAEDLIEISDEYRKIIKPIHDYNIKHDLTMLIYSAYDSNFGNPTPPKKDEYQQSKMQNELIKRQNTTLYPSIEVNLLIKDPKKMLVNHKRKYQIENISDEPIKYVLHGIGTDVEKQSIHDLKLRVYDESNKEMKISSINLDKPTVKEFSTVFSNPVTKGEKNRGYTLEYEVEEPERFFENAFVIDCKNFTLSIALPENNSMSKPILYEMNQETEEKTKSNLMPNIEKTNGQICYTWQKNDIVKGQTFRIEW